MQFVAQFNRRGGGGNNVMQVRLTAASRMTPPRRSCCSIHWLSHALSTWPYSWICHIVYISTHNPQYLHWWLPASSFQLPSHGGRPVHSFKLPCNDIHNWLRQFSISPKDYENFGLKIGAAFGFGFAKALQQQRRSKMENNWNHKTNSVRKHKLCITNVLLTHCHFLIQLKWLPAWPGPSIWIRFPKEPGERKSFGKTPLGKLEQHRSIQAASQTLIWHSYASRNESCNEDFGRGQRAVWIIFKLAVCGCY